MYSLHKISVSVFLVFVPFFAFCGNPYRISSASGMGMGSLCIVRNNLWTSFTNPALLTDNQQIISGINYENRFGLQELSTKSLAVRMPVGKTFIGTTYSYFGYSQFSRGSLIISCGKRLSENISGGVTIDYFSERISGEYQNTRFISFKAGLILDVSEKTSIGISLINPIPDALRHNSLPSSIIFGTGIRLSDIAFFGAEAELSSSKKLSARTGFEYEAGKDFLLRGGYSTEYTSFSLGLGYTISRFTIDLGFATHEVLDITSSLSLIYKIK